MQMEPYTIFLLCEGPFLHALSIIAHSVQYHSHARRHRRVFTSVRSLLALLHACRNQSEEQRGAFAIREYLSPPQAPAVTAGSPAAKGISPPRASRHRRLPRHRRHPPSPQAPAVTICPIAPAAKKLSPKDRISLAPRSIPIGSNPCSWAFFRQTGACTRRAQ